MTITNPTPEPGQHVWIEAEAWYPDGWKSPLLCPLGTDGQPKKRDGFGVGAVVWHPVDVPPQPPVLAPNARDALASAGRAWATLVQGLRDRGETTGMPGAVEAVTAALNAIDRARAEQDSQQRLAIAAELELNQLRGGIARVHDRIAADASTNRFQPEKAKLERICGWLTDELAAADLGIGADVLPQPPVLAPGAIVRLSTASGGAVSEKDTTWVVQNWWRATLPQGMTVDDSTLLRLLAAPTSPPADVPGPDDSTPTPGEIERKPESTGPECKDQPLTLNSAGVDTSPPSGEGAALIAATEAELADQHSAAFAAMEWEATARRLADDVDRCETPEETQPMRLEIRRLTALAAREADDPASVQATTHGEAGEAHRAAEGFASVGLGMLMGVPSIRQEVQARIAYEELQARYDAVVEHGPQKMIDDLAAENARLRQRTAKPAVQGAGPNASQPAITQPECKGQPETVNSGDVDAVQGAGRDWRGEIEAVIRSALERQAAHPGRSFVGWGVVAAEIVAALGLHDLEQAAAEARADVAKLWDATGIPADAEVDVDFVAGSIRTMLDTSRIARTQLRPQLARAEADAAAARRELEQLCGEVERIRVDLPAIAGRQPGAWGVANELDGLLRAALAVAAPATQDGDTNG